MYTYEQAQEILKRFTTATVEISDYIIVDRTLGQMMLACNIEPKIGVAGTNRFSSGSTIIVYHHDMLRDLWLPTNQGIGFDTQGHLVDGAHRLKAFVRATEIDPHKTLKMLVCGGLDPRVKRLVDKGRKRTKAQDLHMEGHTSTNHLQAVTRLVWCYDNVPYSMNAWELKASISSDEMLEMLNSKYVDIPDAIRSGSKLKSLMHVTAASVATYIGRRDAEEGAADYFNARLQDGLLDHASATHPIYRLREFLRLNKPEKGRRSKYSSIYQVAIWIKCFNAFIEEREVSMVSFKTTDIFPRIKGPKPVSAPPADDEQLDATDYLLQEEDEFQRLMKALDKGPSK